ncbi:argininosuccinate lyase [Marinivivus vitaminiproducens]|uniref:argininosuccinate lyase n=1 Tax=Marinivivus vitaminiproducens TaxID=3035935 RepID=UPI00279D4FE3|nr:argininosuccinate lyase [Geminicoccaceae bacterium SCSIO 64248]
MDGQHAVSIRERVKLPPSRIMIETHWKPKMSYALRHGFQNELWVHVVHAKMLEKQGIISPAHLEAILGALANLAERGPDALEIDYTIEDLYSYTERYLARTLGPDVGGRLHTGRSRNDLGVTTGRMILRELMLDVMAALSGLRRVVFDLAERHIETVMPGYTHWQHAQPITLGYYLLSYADLLQRDWQRCMAALRSTNLSPLGAGALAGTSFPLDREYTARELGFDGLVEVCYDAVSNRDDGHETAAALAVLMTGLSRVAVDLQTWSTLEYAFVELGDEHSSVSSIMPQKKNPASLEHLKAEAARVTGAISAALAASKNTTFAEISDGVTGVDLPARDAAETTGESLRLMTEVLEKLTVFPERMLHSARIGFGTATELADVIVTEAGLSFRMAHNIVATVVSKAIEQGRRADEITAADVSEASRELFGQPLQLSEVTLRGALDPVQNVARRTVAGGPAPDVVAAMIARRRPALQHDLDELAALRARVDEKRATALGAARAKLAA